MARITDYTDLQAALSEWLRGAGDTSLADRADEFIELFEAEFVLDSEMRTFEMEEIDTATITADPTPLPDGFLEMVRLRIIGADGARDQVLTYLSPQAAAIRDAETQTTSGGTGVVGNYTVLAGQIFLCPTVWIPTGSTLELAYYKFTKLVDSVDGINWLLTKYPNIYLYGSLMQAAAYIDDKETVAQWTAGLTTAMAKLARSDKKRKIGSGPLVIRPSTGFVR